MQSVLLLSVPTPFPADVYSAAHRPQQYSCSGRTDRLRRSWWSASVVGGTSCRSPRPPLLCRCYWRTRTARATMATGRRWAFRTPNRHRCWATSPGQRWAASRAPSPWTRCTGGSPVTGTSGCTSSDTPCWCCATPCWCTRCWPQSSRRSTTGWWVGRRSSTTGCSTVWWTWGAKSGKRSGPSWVPRLPWPSSKPCSPVCTCAPANSSTNCCCSRPVAKVYKIMFHNRYYAPDVYKVYYRGRC